jgi:hypothetical protein
VKPGIPPAEKILVERWNGRAWKLQANPAAAKVSGLLTGVSCPSASNCTAVGNGEPPHGRQHVLVEHWNGRRWGLQFMPVAKGQADPELIGVTCAAAENCTAVGFYIAYPGNDQYKTLAERHGS